MVHFLLALLMPMCKSFRRLSWFGKPSLVLSPFAERAVHGLDGVRGVLDLGVGINRGHRLGKARPAVHGGDPEVFDVPIVPIREHSEPEVGVLGQLQAEPLLVAVQVQRQPGVHGFRRVAALVAGRDYRRTRQFACSSGFPRSTDTAGPCHRRARIESACRHTRCSSRPFEARLD